MGLVAPLADVDPVLASLSTFSSVPMLAPHNAKSETANITGRKQDHITGRGKGARKCANRLSTLEQILRTMPDLQKSHHTKIPERQELLKLFRCMNSVRPGLVCWAKELKKLLLAEMGWHVSAKRVNMLWLTATEDPLSDKVDSGNDDEALEVASDASVEIKIEEVETALTDPTTIALTAQISSPSEVAPSQLTTYDSNDTRINGSMAALTSPSDIEVMTFLWDLEQEHIQLREDVHGVLQFMVQYKNWKVSEKRLHRILDGIDEANADDEFDMPVIQVDCASHRLAEYAVHSSLPTQAEEVESTQQTAEEAILHALIAPSPGQRAQSLRDIVYKYVQAQTEVHADKITDMMLDLEDDSLVSLIANCTALKRKVEQLCNLCIHDANSQNSAALADGSRLTSIATNDTARTSPDDAVHELSWPIKREHSDEDKVTTYTRDKSLQLDGKRRRDA